MINGNEINIIAVEGSETAGKTTLIPLIADYIREQYNIDICATFEPGATELGHDIRQIVKNVKYKDVIDPKTDVLLYLADRNQHMVEIVREAKVKGQLVILDRSAYTSFAIQSGAFGFDKALLTKLHDLVVPDWKPDLVIYLDVNPEVIKQRTKNGLKDGQRDPKNVRFESYEMDFHWKVRQAYLNMVADDPERWMFIDASGTIEENFEKICVGLDNIFQKRSLGDRYDEIVYNETHVMSMNK